MKTRDLIQFAANADTLLGLLVEGPTYAEDTDFDMDKVRGSGKGQVALQHKLKYKNAQIIGTFGGLDILKADKTIYCLDKNTQQFTFVVQYRMAKYSFLPSHVTQIKIWKDNLLAPANLVPHVFFNYVLPTTGLALTDCVQTRDGQRMWSKLIRHALLNNLYVYFVDTVNKKVVKINSLYDFQDKSQFAYGSSPACANYKFAISLNELN